MDMETKENKVSPRESFSLDFGWRFALGDLDGAERETFDDSSWRRIDLPHDWSIEGPFGEDSPAGGSGAWAPGGIGWYRKRFAFPAGTGDRRARFEFDGVYHQASVYLNGMLLGRHDNGYSSFAFELGAAPDGGGQNLLAVRVDNSDLPNCRWYSGSGIYRGVWLVLFHPLRVDHWGTCVTTPRADAAAAVVSAVIEVRNDLGEATDFTVVNEIITPDGRRIPGKAHTAKAEAGRAVSCRFVMKIRTPALWSPQRSSLYTLVTRLSYRGRQVDEYETRFGIRRVEFRSKRGFFLNGVGMKLKGVCLHHDGGAVGAAVPIAIWERRLKLLKSMGCNAIRCSHNPPDPKLLDLCDSMGFLVIDEAFDKWAGDFAKPEEWWMRQTNFAANWEADLVSMLRRDRNHPSIILWSVGNEPGQPGTDQIEPWLARLAARVRSFEPTRPVSAAFVSSFETEAPGKVDRVMRSAALVDVLCVNYQEPLFPLYHERDPDKVIVSSEAFPHWRAIETSVHAFGLRNPWYDAVELPYVAGQFVWPGIDYLGEANSFPNKGWPGGLIDTTGRMKPGGQFHRSVWSDEPMVSLAVRTHGLGKGEPGWSWGGYELAAHWNWPELENRLLEVEVQTNCDTVELFLNDVSYGEKRSADFINRTVLFLVPYTPGKLHAAGRNGGREVAGAALETAGQPCALAARINRAEIRADGRDLAFVEIELVDEARRRVPHRDAVLTVKVTGPGRLLGLDNGDLASPEGYTDGRRSTANGYCLALVQGTREEGEIGIEAVAEAGFGQAMRTALAIAARLPEVKEKNL
jgi:beta-galactosidase